MSDNQPMDSFWNEWMADSMPFSGHQLVAGGSTGSGLDTSNTIGNYVCYVCMPVTTFKRAGDLTRHLNERHNHVTAAKYLCPIEKCPRGIQGEGFGRMHHLVTHLTSQKHGIERKEAMYIARQHNLPKSKGKAGRQGM